MKKIFILLCLLLLISYSLFALTAHDIFYADSESLKNMASLRGIDSSLSDSEIRNALYEAEGLEGYSETNGEEGTYSVTINSARSLSSTGSIITLIGDVSLSFVNGGEETVVNSDEVVIDTDSALIIAIGNVNFKTTGDSSNEEINADIVSYYWEKGNIVVENASTLNERTNSNDESIDVYSVGERLTYFKNGAAIYEDGYIASSDSDPLSSISASTITMLPGSDMLIENAVLNIGRVPLFYFPIFFFPGSRIVGNPSFGFTSSKGAFINTTFEVFGSTDLIDSSSSSSFLSIFSDQSNEEGQVQRGAYYTSDDNLTPLESWASSSDSHLAVMADAYSSVGLHLGLDTTLNFFDKSLNFDSFTGVALTFSESPQTGHFRYYSENSLSYSFSGLVISLSAPFYSDNDVLREVGNRITSFSIEPLLFQSPTFPSTYSSSLTSFSRYAELRYSLPSSLRTDYLSTFNISRLRVESRHSWVRNRESDKYEFQIDYLNLPELSMNMAGSIFNFEYEDQGVPVEELDDADLFLLKDPLLYEMFHSEMVSEGHASTTYSIGMGYSINESLENNLDYYNGELDSSSFSNDTSLRLTTELDLGSYFRLRNVITPSYSYDSEEAEDSKSWSDNVSVTNSVTAEIPFLGITYTLTHRAYEYDRTHRDGATEIEDSLFLFDSDNVSAHSISFSHTFETIAGNFTPSLSYTIYPLKGSLTPGLSYRYGNFAAAFSYRFQSESVESSDFKSDLVSMSLAYNGSNIVASSSFRYDTSEYRKDNFFYPLELESQLSFRTKDRKYSITEQFEWNGYDTSTGEENYISSLRTILTVPYFTAYVDFSGPTDNIELSDINAEITLDEWLIRAWRGRIYLSLGLSAELNIDVQNIAASSFTITPSIIFSIAEFLDFRLSFTSGNNNFGAYLDGNNNFSFESLWQDLLRSFDLFGEGRYNTNFNMSSISLEIVHYMSDWALHCNYSTSVVLSNNVYRFVPEFSIYLSWNTFPDLSIDRTWEERNGSWQRSD